MSQADGQYGAGRDPAEDSAPLCQVHPFETTRPQAATFRHGMTFTWTRGDQYVAVQNGRVLNARQQIVVVRDLYPGHELLTGQRPVIEWLPAPLGHEWDQQDVMLRIADLWLQDKRDKARRLA